MDDVVRAYARFEEMDAVLDLARYPIPPGGSHEAALRGMRTFIDRSGSRIKIDPEVDAGRRMIQGKEITFREFLGPGYDIDADEVCLFAYSRGARSSSTFEGLAHALLDPPYSLRSSEPLGRFGSPDYAAREKAWMREVLRAFCAEVLLIEDLKRTSHLRIHHWSTEWSSYFEPGHEWWGAFYWTVKDSKNGWVTVIGASATD